MNELYKDEVIKISHLISNFLSKTFIKMLKPKVKVSFERINKWIKKVDNIFGSSLFKDPTKKESLLKKLLYSTLQRHMLMFTFIIVSTLIITNFKLISIIMCSCLFVAFGGGYVAVYIMLSNKDELQNLFNWCEGIYDVEKKYHKVIHKLAETELISIEKRTMKILDWMTKIFFISSLNSTVVFAIIGHFLPENIYPKYSTPSPFYLPFKNQETWLACISTVLYQTFVSVDMAILGYFIYGYLFCFYLQILGFLDIIQKVVEHLKSEICSGTQELDTEVKPKVKATLHLDTLAIINADSSDPHLTFNQWAQILTDMISDVSAIISSLDSLFKVPFFINELSAMGSLFICGLLVMVVRQQYLFGFTITILCSLLYVHCFANEQILEKLEGINESLYDLPWYYLEPKQRKVLMILMHCDTMQKGLTAAGIHSLTFERFGIIVKAGYTNLLVLKDLVMK